MHFRIIALHGLLMGLMRSRQIIFPAFEHCYTAFPMKEGLELLQAGHCVMAGLGVAVSASRG